VRACPPPLSLSLLPRVSYTESEYKSYNNRMCDGKMRKMPGKMRKMPGKMHNLPASQAYTFAHFETSGMMDGWT